MRALVVEAPGRLRLDERLRPESAPEGWVLVDIARVGICGTDYHILEGNQPFFDYPRVIGHELSGRVAEDKSGFSRGELVTINPYVSCGRCRACLRGKPNCCTKIAVLGVHRDGGLTERIAVPAQNLYRADGLTPDQAAMVEFLAIGAHAVRRSGLTGADCVLVVGLGPIGLGTALFAQARGAEVHILDANAERLARLQRDFGFANTHALDDGPEVLMAATGGDGFDVVFDATGSARAIEAGFALVGHGGTYVLVSVVKDKISFLDPEFHKRETTLMGSRNATREDFETVKAALADGTIDSSKLKTHAAALRDVVEALSGWSADRRDIVKAIVTVAD
ncbi:zinc-binding alcohol dehydrogenase family protein [Aurantimonas sp. VKM B-3413]|uniref:zinc-binding alcohol dehydrogenase family protein n=1 Tax=Aurantimonas sp. VKM B-3413 TaxID=2779401 RepID=UPI001E300CA4|nr:zinc-binding alcohol dehydrogenase family protein [Aurantimonas sp. VKM B-3413]MCB8839804.1 zinc-binding alcohol dehydrogenase family protein [Aurantimonas sp. VKM B-3413]